MSVAVTVVWSPLVAVLGEDEEEGGLRSTQPDTESEV